MSGEMTCIQCTIVGDKKVGKSTISRGLCETEGVLDIHNNNYQSTIFDNIAGKFHTWMCLCTSILRNYYHLTY